MMGRRALITERDVKELVRFLGYTAVGFLLGRAVERAYDRRRYFVEEADLDGDAFDVLRRALAS